MGLDQPKTAVDETETSDESERVLGNYIAELESRFSMREKYRTKHAAIFQRQSDSFSLRKDKLDASVKKNTTFVKKLKVFSGVQVEALLADLRGLNCSKYISEVAAAMVEAKLKMTDIEPALKFCSEITELYPEFSQHFFECWQKCLSIKSGEKISNPSKLRIDLRFYAELILVGLFNNTKHALGLLGSLLTFLVNMDKDDHVNFSILLTFCKTCGDDFAAILPRRIRQLSEKYQIEVPKSRFLPVDKQLNVQNLLKDYYYSMCKHLRLSATEVQECDKQNHRILQTKGELNAERKEHCESLQNAYEKLLNAVQNFAELLDVDLPELKITESAIKEENIEFLSFDGDQENNIDVQIWPDIEIRKFYTELINLRDYLPSNHPLLLNLNKKMMEKPVERTTEEDLDKDISDEDESGVIEEEVEEPLHIPATNKAMFDTFLNNLPNCISRELIDSAAINFATTLNNKHTRKKITRVLFSVNRTRLDLLPFYGRFVANLHQALPDIGNELAQMLRVDFKYHVKKRDQINFESKIKVVRYIGEMVKFRVYPKIEALYCLKVLLNNFSHHHIEMACNLLEVCGRFLYLNPDSHQRTKVYVEQMMRKKSVMSLDSRYVMQIDNAYYHVNPPESGTIIKQKERPILHQFLRKILFENLNRTTIEKTVKYLRKFNWDDDTFFDYGVKCLIRAFKVKYLNIHCLAEVLAAFWHYQEDVVVCVIDKLFEDIRMGMEANLTRFNQRRVAQINFLGELYAYRLIDTVELFKVLYSLITFGVIHDYNIPSLLDPPDNLFRIKLVCVLLDTVGKYLNRRNDKKRLEYFLLFFQSYYWFKKCDPFWASSVFPINVEHQFEDTVKSIRPKFRLAKSREKALDEIEKLKKLLGIDAVLAKIVNNDNDDDNDNTTELVYGLEIINETEEDEVDDIKDRPEISDDDFDEKELQNTEEEDYFDEDEETEDEKKTPDNIGDHCAEDNDFIASFDKMITENIQERMKVNVKPKNVDISIPRSIKTVKKSYSELQEEIEKDKMNFVLILRKGNKSKLCNFQADLDSDLAKNLKNREIAEREEKEKVKQLTLNITERLEEEDYREMLQQQQRQLENNFNREKKKYQHPKGAPDADLIFGTK